MNKGKSGVRQLKRKERIPNTVKGRESTTENGMLKEEEIEMITIWSVS